MTKQSTEVNEQQPADFHPQTAASALYLEIDNELLLVQQALGSPEEGCWGVPAGKLKPNESPESAAKRELFEETGIKIQTSSELHYLGTLYIRKSELDYTYYVFQGLLDHKPTISLSAEHKNYRWANRKELEDISLRAGVKQALLYYRKHARPPIPHFRFAHATSSQRALIHEWLKQDYIREWIHGQGLANTLTGLEKFFQDKSNTTYWIGSDHKIPFAFLITSFNSAETITFDVFICDPTYLGKGFSVPMIRAFLTQQFPRVKKILIDPEVSNARAIHVYKKVGFQIVGEFIAGWHPVPHYQMELLMQDLVTHRKEPL